MIARIAVTLTLTGIASFLGWQYVGSRPPLTPDAQWYQSIQHNGQVHVVIGDGSIVIMAKRVEGRTLMDPVLEQFDKTREMTKVSRARSGKLQFDDATNSLLVTLHVGKTDMLDGSSFEYEEFSFSTALAGAE